MQTENYLAAVKAQYEALPYPPVDPRDEHKRLARTWLDDLPMINHYCFGGRQNFADGFRVLVAGGGTGDATIFLAEQLRASNARIVHVDLSSASIGIARERAAIRKLDNIEWRQESLLDLPRHGLEPFDYINCVGVLHHLADPEAGLRALQAVLKPNGAIGLMLYGAIGRIGVYHMQEMLRLTGASVPVRERIVQAKELLGSLPASNWYRMAGDLYNDRDTDAGIVDSLLHPQDRAYTVPQLYDWLHERAGFALAFSDVHRGRFPYMPELTLGHDAHALRARLGGMAVRERQALAELLIGDVTRHNLYLTHGAAAAVYGDATLVPFYFHEQLDSKVLASMFAFKKGQPTILRHEFIGMTAAVPTGPYCGRIFSFIDGKRSFQQIFDLVRAGLRINGVTALPDNSALFADFRPAYDVLNAIERILLRAPAT